MFPSMEEQVVDAIDVVLIQLLRRNLSSFQTIRRNEVMIDSVKLNQALNDAGYSVYLVQDDKYEIPPTIVFNKLYGPMEIPFYGISYFTAAVGPIQTVQLNQGLLPEEFQQKLIGIYKEE
jgi:hypothetical protein